MKYGKWTACAVVTWLVSVPTLGGAQDCLDWSAGPRLMGSVDLPGPLRALVVAGTWAYGLNGALFTYDVSGAAPVLTFTNAVPATEVSLVVDSGRAFVAHYDGVTAYDLSVPGAPAQRGTAQLGRLGAISVVGNYVYATMYGSGSVYGETHIVDFSNLDAPVVIGTVAMNGEPSGSIVTDGTRGVVGTRVNESGMRFAGLAILDLSDPTSPVVEEWAWFSLIDHGIQPLRLDGDILLGDVGSQSCFGGIDCPCPVSLRGIQRIDLSTLIDYLYYNPTIDPGVGDFKGIVHEDRAYVFQTDADDHDYVNVLDLSDLNNVTIDASIPMGFPWSAAGVRIGTELRLLVSESGSLRMYDVTDLEYPSLADRSRNTLALVAADDSFAYEVNYTYTPSNCSDYFTTESQVRKYDRNSVGPVEVSRWSYFVSESAYFDWPPHDAEIAGGALWIATRRLTPSSIYRCDISGAVPQAPVIDPYATGLFDMEPSGGYLLGAAGPSGIRVLNPTDPLVEVAADATHDVRLIQVDGDLAVTIGVGSTSAEVVVRSVDVSNPLTPVFLGSLTLPYAWSTLSLALRGDLAAIGSTSETWLVDLSAPSTPEVVGTVPIGGYSAIDGGILYVGSAPTAVDVHDPTAPVVIGSVFSDGAGPKLALPEGIYVCDTGVLGRLPHDCHFTGATDVMVAGNVAPGRLSLAPNPFSSTTRIVYELGGDAFLAVDVYDVTGRRIRRLMESNRRAGTIGLEWDGLDARGRPAPAGVYFVRVSTGDEVTAGKVVRAR
ncbi:MAG: T9SS type A sorting domain-containing protein [bacterium]